MRNKFQAALSPLLGLCIAVSGLIRFGCNEGKERKRVPVGDMQECL